VSASSPRFRTAAVGGTFDSLHKGHAALLGAAFGAAAEVIVGLTGDEFAASRGKAPRSAYAQRLAALRAHIGRHHAGRAHEIRRLDAEYGPAAYEARVDVLVTSAETAHRAASLNEARAAMGVRPVEVIVVPMAMADDGRRVSSTRIRAGEIDAEGRLL